MQTLTETAEKTACYAVFCPASSCNEDVRHGKGSLQKERCRGSIKEILSSTKLPTFIYPHHGCLQAFRPLSSAPKAVCHPSPAYLQPNPLHADRALPGLGAQLGPSKIFQELQLLQSWTRFLLHHLVSMPQPKTSALPVTSPSPPFRLSPILFP